MVFLLAIGGYGLTGALQGLDFGVARQVGSPTPSAALVSPRAQASAEASAGLSRFDPAAPNAANLKLFNLMLVRAAQSTPSSSIDGKALADALTAAGFNAAAMQRSADRTSSNLQAPTLTVSVRLRTMCLVGQFVRSDASISTETASPIGTGACLIGRQTES